MKKIWTLAMLAIFCMVALAQQNPVLPLDPNVRTGTLENGLTYFIRHNNLPENRADFWLIQRVGSMQEEDHQRGLAHFLEHMAFNGTTNFPGNTLIQYLQDNGIRFGQNLNAYVSLDETAYFMTNVPTTNQNLVDSVLLILHDWSSQLLLDPDEIESERGVIREEIRSRGSAQMRIWEQLLPQMFPNSKYGYRLPGGCIDVINTFEHQTLRDFMYSWHRPDLQAIVVVGDVDVDVIEQEIIELFSHIQLKPDRPERIWYPVEGNDEPIFAIATDAEARNARVEVYFKHDLMPREYRNTQMAFMWNYLMSAAGAMMNQRFAEIVQRPNSPFTGAMAFDGDFFVAQTKNAWTAIAGTDEDKIKVALAALLRETERARRHGFTASEYEIARTNILQRYEHAFNNRGTQTNSALTQPIVRKFLSNTASPGIEFEFNLIQQIAPHIPVEMVNQAFQQIFDEYHRNIVVAITGPEREGLVYPTEAELLAVLQSVWAEEIEAHVEEIVDTQLIPTAPMPGQIVSEEHNELFGTTVWTLQNGMRVVLKNTDFRDDQILMTASSAGGFSLFAKDDPINSRNINSVITLGGVGNFSATELPRALAGRTASARPTVSLTAHGFSGSSSIRDFETMLQLVHLYFTAPRIDDDAFTAFLQRTEVALRNQEAEPRVAWSDAITAAMYGDNPLASRFRPEDLQHLDYHRIMQMYKQLFSNPGSFTFTFVGNVDEDAVRPIVEKYLASLPGQAERGEFVKLPLDFLTGETENIFRREMLTPTANIFIARTGRVERNQRNNILMAIFSQSLEILYNEVIREQEGGTYGVNTSGSVSRYPEGQTILQIVYDTSEELFEHLNSRILSELQNVYENGVNEVHFNRVIEHLNNNHNTQLRQNGYWLSILDTKYFFGEDLHSNFLNIVNSVTLDEVHQFARMFLGQGNKVKVVMLPAE